MEARDVRSTFFRIGARGIRPPAPAGQGRRARPSA
jgi:hypothetical protein